MQIRSPWAPVLLPIITLGIYHLVWYYKILTELKQFGDRTGDAQLQTINPMRGLLALFPGAFLLGIPTLISYINTAKHVNRAQQLTHGNGQGIGYLWFVLVPSVGSAIVEYMVQARLNGAWQAAAYGSGAPLAPGYAQQPAPAPAPFQA